MIDPDPSSVADFRLGDWLVEPRLNRITSGDSKVALELKVMQVLVCLAENAGDLVSRKQLTDTVWATEFVSDNTVTHAVTELRNALGDDAKSPTYIETIHRRGYRLVAPVDWVSREYGEKAVAVPPGKPRWPHFLAIGIAAVIGLLVILPTEALFKWRREEPADVPPPRIVVLPFENLGPPEEDHFADGITQEITSRLAAVSGLRVISRTSATYYRNREVPLRQIGEELDVSYVLEGSIRRERAEEGHGRVRVCPQLIRVSDDSHLWSHRYDRELEDIFSIQSDIAEEVLVHIRAMLLEPERELVETQPTENMDAYQAYLAGVQYLESTEEERFLNLGAEMLERAVELDPDFAVAHAKLSEAHSVIYHFRYDFTSVRLEMARAAADRALQLQPDLPEGHRALGWHYYFCQRDYERALAEFAVAAERLPNDSNLQLGIFFVQRRRGNWEEALQALERIQLIDPRGYFAALESMITYGILREFERAEVEMNRAISIAPDHADAYFYGIVIYLRWDGSTDRARSLMASAPSLDSPRMNYFSVLLDMYDRKPEQALARLDELSIDVINLDDRYRPRALLECICLSQMGERSRAEEACASAVALLESELEMRPHDFRLHSAIGHAYALLGRKKDAVAAGERSVDLLPVSQDIIAGSDQAIELAKIYAQVSETEKALDLIEQLLANPGGFLIGPFTTDPVWDPLRDHPRFQALLEKYETQAN